MESPQRRPSSHEPRTYVYVPPQDAPAAAPFGMPHADGREPDAVPADEAVIAQTREIERLKGSMAAAQRLRGEFSTTIFSALIGGVCVSLFNMQPASATGAMLQEGMHFVHDPLVATDLPTGLSRQLQVLTLLRFSVMLMAVAAGTGWGRVARLRAAEGNRRWLQGSIRYFVSAGSVFALACLTVALYSSEQALSGWQQTWICALFAFSNGILWGLLPEDNATTARSFLIKRAALGDLWAVRQVVLFLFCVGFAVTLYQNIIVTNASLHLIGTIVLGLGLADTGYLASSVSLATPMPVARQTDANRIAPYVSTALMIVFAIACFAYLRQAPEVAAYFRGTPAANLASTADGR